MALEITLTGNNKVRLNPQYPTIAGVDANNVPRLFKVKPDGTLDLGGVTLPIWETFEVQYYGSTNNVHLVIYKLSGNEVGRWTLTYLGGGTSNDDLITGAVFTTP